MDKKLNDLLDKLDFPSESKEYFNNCKIEKIVVKEEKQIWDINIKSDNIIPYNIIDSFTSSLSKCVNNKYKYLVTIITDDNNLDLVFDYYKNILILINNNNLYYDMFLDRLKKDNDTFYIEIYNSSEKNILSSKMDTINALFKRFGFKINLELRLSLDASNLIKEEIKEDYAIDTSKFDNVNTKKTVVKEQKEGRKYGKDVVSNNPNQLFGNKAITGESTSLSELNHEVDNVNVEALVFGVVPSNKKGFNSLTLKVTDNKTSMYVRIFCNTEELYNDLLCKIKEGMWLKINGYVKNNTFYNDFVLNARNIEILEKEVEEIVDDAIEKRVELHTHTMMSQMDGVVPVKDLIKRAVKWGHKAIAITDHNAIQTFPECYHHKDEIKILYGVELAMIDDDLDLVVRSNDSILEDNTYVVFDFETTGFNAGGGDSIIEIGAVKLYKGEIIDRFDKLIDPGYPIPPHITNITNITDEMVKGCPNEREAVTEFIAWCGDLPMVAHNAKFDSSFLEMAYKKYDLGEYKNPLLDTLQISRGLEPAAARHSLSALVKRYDVPWDEDAHHRADYDAEGTAYIFSKMIDKLKTKQIIKMNEVEGLVSREDIHKFGNLYHITLLVKNKTGLKNLFKLVSYANTKYLYKTPRILRSVVNELREGLLVGSACADGEIFTLARSKSDEELSDLMNFYDYIEVQPPEVYRYLIDLDDFKNELELRDNIKKIIDNAKKKNKIVVATGDVHHLDRSDKIYREIIINQKVPGGGRHPLNRPNIKEIPSQHFRTTKEMLEDFNFLDEGLAHEIVIENTNKIADQIEEFEIIPDTKGIPFSPIIENSKQIIKDTCYDKAHEIYGNPLPPIIEDRLNSELTGIINGGFDAIYLIAERLVKHSNADGYTVGSRGSVGSSFVATMLGITEVNPLPAHYVCPNCKKSIFSDENNVALGTIYASGYDMPDKVCECGCMMKKEGQDMPFATFLGFNADKVPDIDLNFSGDYQARAHDYTKVLFGEDHVFRAGTIGTVAEKTAYGFVKGYFEDREINDIKPLEIERLARGVTGVKRTTGQHPGGIVVVPDYKDIFDFTPFQLPADDPNAEWFTTHFNYHDIESCLLKLDILGHDNPTMFKMLEDLTGIDSTTIPMDDKEIMSLFTSTKALGVTPEQINSSVGCVGLPEFTRFVIGIVEETKPTTFAELVKISGLSHGTDVWNGNAQDIVRDGIVPFKEVIGCRDDIMVYLMNHGVEPLKSFKIMEFVRKGKASKDPAKWLEFEQDLKDAKIPEWFITSCGKIKYMFPKAHATAYVTAAWRIAWYKIHRAIEYYAAFFSIRCFAFDLEAMEAGYQKIREKYDELNLRKFSLSVKEQDLYATLEMAVEMSARGYKFGAISLEKSHFKNFIIDEDRKTLIPPFRALDGLGDTVGKNIVEEREKGEFLSIEDLQKRCKVSSTLIEKMKMMGILKELPESSQISIFDMF